MKYALLVFLGGGIGSVLRYLVGKLFQGPLGTFPTGTMTVNVIGSLLIGILVGYGLKNGGLSEPQTLLLVTGFCGGFTTFSTFALENQTFLKTGDYTSFVIYTFGSLFLGISAVILGLFLSKNF
ncbi:MAG: fluoride efflux transporter CrcB [Flavobacteriaceae bacterium]|jgi:fluoride exporter|nr:fluoride efflux transporter CrcB [Flavobacteriaceae bacterium]